MTSAKQSGLLFDVARFSEKDAQFDGNLKSMEALSIGEFKATLLPKAIAWSKTP
jgi:hypothetical protein